MGTCIYCGDSFDPSQGEGDHVLPARFGKFKNALVFRGVCTPCNNQLGQAEEQLTRSSPEAVWLRKLAPPFKRKRRGEKNVGAKGAKPPRHYVFPKGQRYIARPVAGTLREAVSPEQLAIKDADNREHNIELFPSVTSKSLHQKLAAINPTPPFFVRILSHKENLPKYLSLLKDLFPDSPFTPLNNLPPNGSTVPERTTLEFTSDYWRAIAKIAFHYFLTQTKSGLNGSEPCFEKIRRFITEGGNQSDFFGAAKTKFHTGFAPTSTGGWILPTCWAHLLNATEEKDEVATSITMFIGPEHPPYSHEILLGYTDHPNLIIPGRCYSHVYRYESSDDRYCGTVYQDSLTSPYGII